MRVLVASASVGAAALAFAAVADAQATVRTNHACYVVGQTAQLSGSGFTPSATYTVMLDGVFFGSNSTNSGGGFSISLHPGGLPAGAAQHTDRVSVDDGNGNMSSTSFTLTRATGARLIDASKSSRGVRARVQLWGFSLNGTHRQVYMHYVGPNGHAHSTVKVGTTTGACGHLLSAPKLFLPFSLSKGVWTLQLDTRSSYARRPDGAVARLRVSIG